MDGALNFQKSDTSTTFLILPNPAARSGGLFFNPKKTFVEISISLLKALGSGLTWVWEKWTTSRANRLAASKVLFVDYLIHKNKIAHNHYRYTFSVSIHNNDTKPISIRHLGWRSEVTKTRWDMILLSGKINGEQISYSTDLSDLSHYVPHSDPILVKYQIPPQGMAEFVIDIENLFLPLKGESQLPYAEAKELINSLSVLVDFSNGELQKLPIVRKVIRTTLLEAVSVNH